MRQDICPEIHTGAERNILMDKLKMLVVRNTNIFAHGIKKVGK
jgi:hypothetical protein